MKKIFFIFFLTALNLGLSAQQYPVNNQILFNKFSYIPAYAGFSGISEVFTGYRQQWLGIKGAPSLGSAYFSSPFANNMGLGLSFSAEKTGNFSNFFFSATYAYHIRFGTKTYLSLGFSPVFSRKQLNLSSISSYGPQIDPALQNINSLIINTFDVGASLNFYASGFNFGLNVPQTITQFAFSSVENLNFKVQREFFGYMSYKFAAGNFVLEPLVKAEANAETNIAYEGLFAATVKNFTAATGYKSDGALIFQIGVVSKNNLFISYGYEAGISGIPHFSNGTHEITLGFLINSSKFYKKYTSVFRPSDLENKKNNDLENKLDLLEQRVNVEVATRTKTDEELQRQIDSLKALHKGEHKDITEDIKPTEPQWVDTVISYGVNFGYMNDRIFSSSFPELDKYAKLLENDPDLKMKVVVHIDSIFSRPFSLELTRTRAQAVAKYITAKPGLEGRVYFEGKGADEPIAPNNDVEGRKKNRRVEFLFNKKVKL